MEDQTDRIKIGELIAYLERDHTLSERGLDQATEDRIRAALIEARVAVAKNLSSDPVLAGITHLLEQLAAELWAYWCPDVEEYISRLKSLGIFVLNLFGELADGAHSFDVELLIDEYRALALRLRADASDDHGTGDTPSERNWPISHKEACKAERKKLRDDYRAECKRANVFVTDEMIAKGANSQWNSRSNIQKWLSCDPKYDGKPDRLIRDVSLKKPHLPKSDSTALHG